MSDHLSTGVGSEAVRRLVYSHLSAETTRLVVNLRTHFDSNVGWSARAETWNKEYDCIQYQLSPHIHSTLFSTLPTISLVYIIAALTAPQPEPPSTITPRPSTLAGRHLSPEQSYAVIIAACRPNTWSSPRQVNSGRYSHLISLLFSTLPTSRTTPVACLAWEIGSSLYNRFIGCSTPQHLSSV